MREGGFSSSGEVRKSEVHESWQDASMGNHWIDILDFSLDIIGRLSLKRASECGK